MYGLLNPLRFFARSDCGEPEKAHRPPIQNRIHVERFASAGVGALERIAPPPWGNLHQKGSQPPGHATAIEDYPAKTDDCVDSAGFGARIARERGAVISMPVRF